jgi:hypothetical protein
MFDLLPKAAAAFVADMRAYHAEQEGFKREEIAARQIWLLNQHLPARIKLRLPDVKELLERMQNEV